MVAEMMVSLPITLVTLQFLIVYAHTPTGGSNNNGIEIDDGSQYVFLSNNRTKGNFGGLEIKAHSNTSAASGVFVNGHVSIEDTRAYNIRHIGHHRAKTDNKV